MAEQYLFVDYLLLAMLITDVTTANYCLEKINNVYKNEGKHLSAKYEIARDLPIIKKNESYKWLNNAHSSSFIYTAEALDSAFEKFFKKRCGFPKFKSKSYGYSFTKQVKIRESDAFIDWKNGYMNFSKKCGKVKIILHRKFKGTIKTATISKKSYDYYEVSLLVDDVNTKEELKKPTLEGTIGIDLGVKEDSNAILSDGTKFPVINCDKYVKKIKRFKRKLSKKQWLKTGETKFSKKYNKEVEIKKPSKNYIKLKDKIAKLEDKIKMRRGYNTHQITSYVSKNDRFDTVCIEDLNVKGMTRSHHIANRVSNANMGEISRQLSYKCDWYGKNLVKVDRFFASSQICSVCGYKNEAVKDLNVRKWICPKCGTEHDRDINAAMNIKNEGFRKITEEKLVD